MEYIRQCNEHDAQSNIVFSDPKGKLTSVHSSASKAELSVADGCHWIQMLPEILSYLANQIVLLLLNGVMDW